MADEALSPQDPSSFSKPEDVIIRNINISLEVDFPRKVLFGNVQLIIERINPLANHLILDVKSLNISSIVDSETENNLTYFISDTKSRFGSKLTIDLPTNISKMTIQINYETSPNASGLQWLSPQQTSGKIHSLMFSQLQPIHARSVLPCQDTPSVKTPYTAEIIVKNPMTVLMSAVRGEKLVKGDKTTYFFNQSVPIPSYLIAIAVGAFESREIGPRSHVWAEKEIINKAAYEFAETEKQLKTAEEICGSYVWGIYDLLVLPPSFSYGGMENPCLTFVTPTLLAGDRSLANVVAHEITHSWSGNLVTNRNFEHFWLNEGFTRFIELKIIGRLTSEANKDLIAINSANKLQETVNLLGPKNPLTSLVVNLNGVHPDDAFSSVPYEKGYMFLRYLQNIIGGSENMENFLVKYFDTYKYKSIDTNDFKNYFTSYFASNSNILKIDWNEWLYSPGMPKEIPHYDDSLVNACDKLKDNWVTWNLNEPFSENDLKSFTTDQKIYFFNSLLKLDNFLLDKLKIMEQVYKLKEVRNAEIRFVWLRLCLKARWEEKINEALEMVTEFGRMKYTRPLYRDLYAWPLARPKAIENFENTRKEMMIVSAELIAKDLHLSE